MKKRIICSIIVIVFIVLAATVVGYATIDKSPEQNKVQVEQNLPTPEPKPEPKVVVEPPTKEELEAKHLDKCAREYPTATKIWRYMRYELGWNNYVCAGVMGNMMAECGGQTLALDPTLYDAATGSYYGICQWSSKWNPDVIGTGVDFQLKYIKSTVESEFKTFGYLYSSGFTYEDFKNLQDPEEAALAFAAVYERCSSRTYYIREENALKAYDYFVLYSN